MSLVEANVIYSYRAAFREEVPLNCCSCSWTWMFLNLYNLHVKCLCSMFSLVIR